MKKILLVDDEKNVLSALQRELRSHFEIEAFDNPVTALERCRDQQFDLVIADYKMPEMNGIEFLKKFGALQPDASRLVLSGEADIEALVRTINETHIYRFLAKPWEKAELLSSIEQAVAYRDAILANRATATSQAAKGQPENTVYRIVLVENDPHLQSAKVRGLTDESGHANLYGAMQHEIGQAATQAKKFKCTVEAFANARDTIAYAEKNEFDLVIATQLLPDMEGIQLLSKLKKLVPNAARILISDEPSKAMLSQAINDAEVQNMLRLHWGSSDAHADIRRQAWNIYQLKTAAIQALAARDLLLGK
ncbi:MAG: response regulator [Gallionellaceae bacterium]